MLNVLNVLNVLTFLTHARTRVYGRILGTFDTFTLIHLFFKEKIEN